jgi:uncharacterized protein YndB with AHSA1/START domain
MATQLKSQPQSSAASSPPATQSAAVSPRKMGLLPKILIGLAILIVALLGIIAMQPSDFRITRSAKMSAPAEAVFAQVNDFHRWNDWSPWAKMDPAAKNTFDGPDSGKDASFWWSGNDEVGEGRMTIVESKPSELVSIRLDFEKPFKATCTSEFAFKPDGDQTAVTWTMSGKNDFMGKAISLVMNCDKMVGTEFEKGLANMKAIVEAPPSSGETTPSDSPPAKTEG